MTAVNEPEFSLTSERGDFTVVTDESTQYRTRGADRDVFFDNLKAGGKVVVFGKKTEKHETTIRAKLVGIQSLRNENDR